MEGQAGLPGMPDACAALFSYCAEPSLTVSAQKDGRGTANQWSVWPLTTRPMGRSPFAVFTLT